MAAYTCADAMPQPGKIARWAQTAPQWGAQYLPLEIDDPQQELFLKQYLLSYFSNPPIFDEDEGEKD